VPPRAPVRAGGSCRARGGCVLRRKGRALRDQDRAPSRAAVASSGRPNIERIFARTRNASTPSTRLFISRAAR
jgi:hypothetical protein